MCYIVTNNLGELQISDIWDIELHLYWEASSLAYEALTYFESVTIKKPILGLSKSRLSSVKEIIIITI